MRERSRARAWRASSGNSGRSTRGSSRRLPLAAQPRLFRGCRSRADAGDAARGGLGRHQGLLPGRGDTPLPRDVGIGGTKIHLPAMPLSKARGSRAGPPPFAIYPGGSTFIPGVTWSKSVAPIAAGLARWPEAFCRMTPRDDVRNDTSGISTPSYAAMLGSDDDGLRPTRPPVRVRQWSGMGYRGGGGDPMASSTPAT